MSHDHDEPKYEDFCDAAIYAQDYCPAPDCETCKPVDPSVPLFKRKILFECPAGGQHLLHTTIVGRS